MHAVVSGSWSTSKGPGECTIRKQTGLLVLSGDCWEYGRNKEEEVEEGA